MSINISIINTCNRRCEYCFQKNWYLSKKADPIGDASAFTMTPKTFESLCAWASQENTLKLMGGEPLLHPNLATFFDIAAEQKKSIVLITNLSTDERSIMTLIKTAKRSDSPLTFCLINTDYPQSQEEVFLNNLRDLCRTSIGITLGTTLLPNASASAQSCKRLEKAVSVIRRVRGQGSGFGLRVAPFCPNPLSESFQPHNFTANVVELINRFAVIGFSRLVFDCPVNLCELDFDLIQACQSSGMSITNQACGTESSMPLDVLVDDSVIWCSSANFLRLNSWRDYPDVSTAKKALLKRYHQVFAEIGMAPMCLNCTNSRMSACPGLCIAKTAACLARQDKTGPRIRPISRSQ